MVSHEVLQENRFNVTVSFDWIVLFCTEAKKKTRVSISSEFEYSNDQYNLNLISQSMILDHAGHSS